MVNHRNLTSRKKILVFFFHLLEMAEIFHFSYLLFDSVRSHAEQSIKFILTKTENERLKNQLLCALSLNAYLKVQEKTDRTIKIKSMFCFVECLDICFIISSRNILKNFRAGVNEWTTTI